MSSIPIDVRTWLPGTHRTHAAASSRDDRCRVVMSAPTHRLKMPIYILQQQSPCRSGRFVPPLPTPCSAQSRLSSLLIRLRISSPRHRLSRGLFHRTLKISARSLAHAKRTVTRGPLRPGFHALLTIFLDPQHVFLYIVLSTVLYLAVRVTGLRSVMRAHELQRHA